MDLGTQGKRKGRDTREEEEDDEEDDPLMAALEGISIMDNQGESSSSLSRGPVFVVVSLILCSI
jgi:hypothetical protein